MDIYLLLFFVYSKTQQIVEQAKVQELAMINRYIVWRNKDKERHTRPSKGL